MRFHRLAVVAGLASMLGFAFSAVSAYDSVAHLDRQVHGIHCSFLLGMGSVDASGSTGCHAALMSPYSSVFRQVVWGGVPVSVPAMSVFGFLVFWSVWLVLSGRQRDRRATGFLAAATGVPLLSSAVMGYLSMTVLQTVCKVCIGIYLASTVAFVAAAVLWAQARKQARTRGAVGLGAGGTSGARGADGEPGGFEASELSATALVLAFSLGVVFVAVPVAAYAFAAPDYSHYVGNCGSLPRPEDRHQVLVPMGPQNRETTVIEVLDPLCGACRVFERRFLALQASELVNRKLMLFPLDTPCNWMVDEAIHPGACAVSEAIFCAGDGASEVLNWAFEHQEAILEASRADPGAAERMVSQRFSGLRKCLGSPTVRARLNQSLRWAVQNRLQVLTPQLFVGGLRLCDEDTDLGLDYALPRLVARVQSIPSVPAPSGPAEDREPVRGPPAGRRKAVLKADEAARAATRPTGSEMAQPGVKDKGAEPAASDAEQLTDLAERASKLAKSGGAKAAEPRGKPVEPAAPGTLAPQEGEPSERGPGGPKTADRQLALPRAGGDEAREAPAESPSPGLSGQGARVTPEAPAGSGKSGSAGQRLPGASTERGESRERQPSKRNGPEVP